MGLKFCIWLMIAVLINKKPIEAFVEFNNGRTAPMTEDCGISQVPQTCIKGSGVAPRRAWPWMAAILKDSFTQLHCEGVLLNQFYVLTAAHCLRDESNTYLVSPPMLSVRLGMHNISALNDPDATVFDIEAQKLFAYPQDPQFKQLHDIGLIRLSFMFNFSKAIVPICLNEYFDYDYPDKHLVIAGWGPPGYAGLPANLLKQTDGVVLSNSTCKRFYENLGPFQFTNQQFCLQLTRDNVGYCPGNLGGPAVILDSDGRFVLVGLVSIGYNCKNLSEPAVFTKINPYIRWIKETSDIKNLRIDVK